MRIIQGGTCDAWKRYFSEFREFINYRISLQELGKVHGVEHLALQDLLSSICLTIKIKKSLSKTLKKRLCISKSVASNLVKRMEKNGFVELVTSDKDKRYKYVHLTDFQVKESSRCQTFREAIHEQLLEGISKEDAETAFVSFTKFV